MVLTHRYQCLMVMVNKSDKILSKAGHYLNRVRQLLLWRANVHLHIYGLMESEFETVFTLFA